MRYYEPIWELLKRDGKVSVTAPKALHRRIRKAVKKEKYNDLGYKLMLAERGRRFSKISFSSNAAIITLTLTESLGLEDL